MPDPCRGRAPLEFCLCGGITNAGGACGVTTGGGTDVADACRFNGRISRTDDGACTESDRNDKLPARGGIAGGGPLETTDPCDWTRPVLGSTGGFALGGSVPLIDAGRGGILGVTLPVVVVVAIVAG